LGYSLHRISGEEVTEKRSDEEEGRVLPASVTEIVATGLFFPLLLLLCGSVFVAPMWNRRAGMLRARRAAGFGV